MSYRKIWIHGVVCHIVSFVFTPTSKFKFYYLTVAPILEKSLSQDWNDLVVWNGVTKLSFGPAVVSNDDRKLWVYTAGFFFIFLGSLDTYVVHDNNYNRIGWKFMNKTYNVVIKLCLQEKPIMHNAVFWLFVSYPSPCAMFKGIFRILY